MSNYASNLQYRAWGGLKAMTDGKGYVSSLGYNTKLQPSSFQISGSLVSQTYDYYDDGRISIVHNTSDATFDRSYSYDHAGRLTEAKSGALVNGIQFGGVPYHETFGYDAFSNLTGRTSNAWNDYFADTDLASYSNNKRAGWGYDADGRNTTLGSRTNAFDAAGQQASQSAQAVTFNGFNYTANQTSIYDGDGAMTKEVNTQSNAPGYVNSTYYLRSSVLGNAIVEELDGNGAKNVGYVYSSSGAELANQSGGIVNWKHNTPAGTGQYTVNSYNTASTRTEFDPLGADVSLNAPSSSPPNEGDGDIGAGHLGGIMDARWSDMFNTSSGCTINFKYAMCSEAMMLVNSGAAEKCPDNVCVGTTVIDGKLTPNIFNSHADGHSGYAPFGSRYLGNGLATDPGSIDQLIHLGETQSSAPEDPNPTAAVKPTGRPSQKLSGCVFDVVLKDASKLGSKGLAALKQEISRIYAAAGQEINFVSSGDPSDYNLTIYDSAAGHARTSTSAGETVVAASGVVEPQGEVYADRLTEDAKSDAAFGQNSLALAIALGRAASHEIAHYLLQRNFDRREINNIMNKDFHGGEWFGKSAEFKWQFSAEQKQQLNRLCGR